MSLGAGKALRVNSRTQAGVTQLVSALIGRKLIETRIEGKGVVAAAVAVVVEDTRFLIVII